MKKRKLRDTRRERLIQNEFWENDLI